LDITKLSIAMIEPKYSLNVGYVARTMKNFGLNKLIIVGNKRLGKNAKVFAAHGQEIIDNCEFLSFNEIFKKYSLVIGTTAIATKAHNSFGGALSPEKAARLIRDPGETVILLGRDTTGLTNEELSKCDLLVTIRTGTKYSTLNISHALSIILYAIYQESADPNPTHINRKITEVMIRYLTPLVEKSITQAHKRRRILIILKKLMNESNLTEKQATSLIGFFRKLNLLLKTLN
jgi:TrmH family RNA methyltransferase